MKKNVVVMTIIGMMLLSSFVITPVLGSNGGIIYVDDDNTTGPWDGTQEYPYQYIQDGINAAENGDTVFVYNGTYYENIIVNRSIDLVGEDRDITIINGGASGDVVNISADYVDVSSFTIENGSYGIKIYNSSNNNIIGNTITDNEYGVYIEDSSIDSIIYHNNFIENMQNAYDNAINTWDNGYPSGGNYYSDFDEPSEGAYDNDTDGIVDTAYNISGGENQDRYPLILPFGENLPVADFTYTVDETTVNFASSSYDRDGTIVSYYWEFGDGTNSTEANPEPHEYGGDYQTYAVNLTVIDDSGKNATISKDVTTNDTIKPTVEIVKPKRGLYIRNKKIRPLLFRMALIIRGITIEVNASDEGSGMGKVEFYAGLLGTNYLGNDTTEPYSFNWTRGRVRFFHIQILTVKAYDKAGNVAVKRMIVRKLL